MLLLILRTFLFLNLTMLADEEGDALTLTAKARHQATLEDVQSIARRLPSQLQGSFRFMDMENGIVRPRAWWSWLPLGRRKMKLWRLNTTHHPLWVGEDGIVYHAFWSVFSDKHYDLPVYFKRAEIELGDQNGLTALRNRLRDFEYLLPTRRLS